MKLQSILKLLVFSVILGVSYLPAAAQGTVVSKSGYTVPVQQNQYSPTNFPTYGQTNLPATYGKDRLSTYGTTLPTGGTTGNTTWPTAKQNAASVPTYLGLLAPGSFAGSGTIPSGEYSFGFGAGIPSANGGFPTLPPTATSSVDLNITDDNGAGVTAGQNGAGVTADQVGTDMPTGSQGVIPPTTYNPYASAPNTGYGGNNGPGREGGDDPFFPVQTLIEDEGNGSSAAQIASVQAFITYIGEGPDGDSPGQGVGSGQFPASDSIDQSSSASW